MSQQTFYKLRVYELSSLGGAATAIGETSAALLLGGWGLTNYLSEGESLYNVVLIGVAAMLLLIVVLPAWGATVWKMANDRRREEAEIAAITPKVEELKQRLKIQLAIGSQIQAIGMMDQDKIGYAMQLLAQGDIFTIDGHRVTWRIGGMTIPVEFALLWIEKNAARHASAPDQLPADADYSDQPNRDMCRLWNSAIAEELSRLGVVRLAGSLYPPRWLVMDEFARWNALKQIGLTTAASWAEAALQESEQ